MPVFQAILLGIEEQLRRVAVLVEMLGEAALAASEVDEVHFLVRFGVLPPVVLDGGVALQRQFFLDLVPLARIEDEERERPAIDRQTSLLAGHVVGNAVLGLAGGVA